jgi:hypothetical protein
MKSDARRTLADFLAREIGEPSVASWAKRSSLQRKEVERALKGATGMTVDKLQRFADALGVEAWQLLFPGYVRGAPQFPTMSFDAIDVARQTDAIDDETRRRRAAKAVVDLLRVLTDGDHPQAAAPRLT